MFTFSRIHTGTRYNTHPPPLPPCSHLSTVCRVGKRLLTNLALSVPVLQIRIRMGPHWFWSAGSGSGSRRAKMNHSRKKWRNFMSWIAGYSLLRAECFSCSLDVLYGGLGISKSQFLIIKLFQQNSPKSWIWIRFRIETRADLQHKSLPVHTVPWGRGSSVLCNPGSGISSILPIILKTGSRFATCREKTSVYIMNAF